MVFIGSGNCDVSGDHWIQSQRRRWSMPSLLLALTTVMYCWRLTSYTVSWMRLHVLLVARESSIAVWGSLCMSTFIGSTCRNEWSSSSCRWCITAFITRLPGTWWTLADQSPMWPIDDIFVLPGVITSLCLDTVSAHMGVGHLLLPVLFWPHVRSTEGVHLTLRHCDPVYVILMQTAVIIG